MDVAVLRGRIVATLDADADARRRAELDLKTVSPSVQSCQGHMLTIHLKAEEHPGFTDALLEILQAEQEASVRLSSTHDPMFLPHHTRVLILDHSRCLPQESRYERMVTE
jgi:hypothetical protein